MHVARIPRSCLPASYRLSLVCSCSRSSTPLHAHSTIEGSQVREVHCVGGNSLIVLWLAVCAYLFVPPAAHHSQCTQRNHESHRSQGEVPNEPTRRRRRHVEQQCPVAVCVPRTMSIPRQRITRCDITAQQARNERGSSQTSETNARPHARNHSRPSTPPDSRPWEKRDRSTIFCQRT